MSTREADRPSAVLELGHVDEDQADELVDVDDGAGAAGEVAGPGLVRLLAGVLLDPKTRARFLEADNRAVFGPDGWASPATAVGSGRAWFGYVAGDVLAWDLDDMVTAAAGEVLADELAGEGVPFVLAASGRPGHRHLWAVVVDDVDRAWWTRRADELGLPSPRPTMRPPGSPHRLGLATPIFRPTGEDLVQLPGRIAAARRVATGEREPLRWRTLLATGQWHRGYRSDRSDRTKVFLICVHAIREGLDRDQVAALLAEPAHAGAAAFHRRLERHGKSQADEWLARYVWPVAVAAVESRRSVGDVDEARAAVDERRAWHASLDWSGQAGETDRRVLGALTWLGWAQGSLYPQVSHRQLAEWSGVSRRTVGTSVKRLRLRGAIEVQRLGRGRNELHDDAAGDEPPVLREHADATTWYLLPPPRGFSPRAVRPPATHEGGANPRARSLPRRDLFRGGRQGLTLSAEPVLDALVEHGPLTVDQILEHVPRNRNHLRHRILGQLKTHGLVYRNTDGCWHAVEDLDDRLAQLADELGVAGRTEALKAQHQAEREKYLEHRAACRDRRMARQKAARDAWTARRHEDRRQAARAAQRGQEALPDVSWPAPAPAPASGQPDGPVTPLRPPGPAVAMTLPGLQPPRRHRRDHQRPEPQRTLAAARTA
jgi:hypothetical protein